MNRKLGMNISFGSSTMLLIFVVISLVSKDEVQASEIDELVEKTFEGSLPSFIAAFTKHKRLSAEDINEIRKMIDNYEEE